MDTETPKGTTMKTDEQFILDAARECRDRRNDWPGMPLSQLPLMAKPALDRLLVRGVVSIVERPAKIAGKSKSVYVIPTGDAD